MPMLEFNNKTPKEVYFGNKRVVKAYFGNKLVYLKENGGSTDEDVSFILNVSFNKTKASTAASEIITNYDPDAKLYIDGQDCTNGIPEFSSGVHSGQAVFKKSSIAPYKEGIVSYNLLYQERKLIQSLELIPMQGNKNDFTAFGNNNSQYFDGWGLLESIKGLRVRAMNYQGLFKGCNSLKTIEDCDFVFSYKNNCEEMFYMCLKLTSIPFEFDTSGVSNMRLMFSNCFELLNIPELDTSNVVDMEHMFSSCSKITEIPRLNTSKCTSMYGMFSSCESLEQIPELDTSNVVSMGFMFHSCKSLVFAPQLDVSKCERIESMFSGCTLLHSAAFIGDPSKIRTGFYMSEVFKDITTNGIFYYDINYDYSKILAILPSTWTSQGFNPETQEVVNGQLVNI